MSFLAGLLDAVYDFVWGPWMLALFLAVGLLFTVRGGFFQFRSVKLWLGGTLRAILGRGSARNTGDKKAMSQFQALCTALAGTIGTGSIVGVATAITAGGPGALFWMWVSALLGMMTSFAEKALGVAYRYKNSRGEWVGGAMIYMERGLGLKWLGLLFSAFCVLASFGIGNMTQSHSIASALSNNFGMPPLLTGLCVAALLAVVIFGGIKRIASVTEKLVPLMAGLYIIGGLAVIAVNAERLPGAFTSIITGAFDLRAASGGILGSVMARAARYGISRGVFSNEAGLGSSVMAHAASNAREPVEQGMWGVFEVFVDTIVVCTITALCILVSGVPYESGLAGVELTTAAFATVFSSGAGLFLPVSIIFFAFATLLVWSYYGQRGMAYRGGERAIPLYRALFVALVVVGSLA